jgi:drug/metabolite transporter (DMT)-like permease
LPVFAALGWEQPRYDSSAALFAAVLFMAIVSIVIGFTIQVWAQRHTPASHAGFLFSLIPVFASVTSYFWLGERLGMREASGAGLILLGIAVTSVGASGEAEPHAPLAQPDV